MAVTVLAVLTLLVWVVGVAAARDTVSRLGGADTVSAEVTRCRQDRLMAPACEVTFEQRGTRVTRELRQGLFTGVDEGAPVEVAVAGDGAVAVAGWRAFADPALLLVLALAFTSYTLRRWARLRPPTGPGHHAHGRASSAHRGELGQGIRPSRRARRSRAHPAA